MQKDASSQAAWALLAEGVTRARVEVHRLQHLMVRAQRLVDSSEHREAIYQVAGDLVEGMPARLDRITLALDRTALALSKMGEEFLSARLPLSERSLVDEAVETVSPPLKESDPYSEAARRVAARHLEWR